MKTIIWCIVALGLIFMLIAWSKDTEVKQDTKANNWAYCQYLYNSKQDYLMEEVNCDITATSEEIYRVKQWY